MNSSIRTLILGSIIFSAILVSVVGVNYALANNPDGPDIEARLKAAVDSGDITQEQADERLKGWKKLQTEGPKDRKHARQWTTEDVKAKIQAAVENGDITQQEADAKLDGLKANKPPHPKNIVSDSYN